MEVGYRGVKRCPNGGDSSISSKDTAKGGGYGGDSNVAGDGGSGGGGPGPFNSSIGGEPIAFTGSPIEESGQGQNEIGVFGNRGGRWNGGGAQEDSNSNEPPGRGKVYTIKDGTPIYYAGGGSGGNTGMSGADGGGGDGGQPALYSSEAGGDGTDGLGGGGGGAARYQSTNNENGGDGGDGIVIIRYKIIL